MKKALILVFSLLIMNCKSFLFFVFWCLFYFEYIWFMVYSIKLWSKWDDYCCVYIKDVDLSDLSTIEVWIEYCRISAFSRLYSLLSRKRMSFINLLLCFFIITFGLPYRLIKISYVLFMYNMNFKDSLRHFYISAYRLNQHKKIEVLRGHVTLNCYTYLKFLNSINFKNLSKEMQFLCIKDFRNLCLYNIKEDSERSKEIELVLSKIKTKEGIIIPPHYGKIVNSNFIHVTSKKPNILESQKFLPAMISAIKPGAKSPGSVLSTDINDCWKIGKSIYVPSSEFDSVVYDYADMYNIPKSRCEYIRDKDIRIQELLHKYTNLSEKEVKILKEEIRNGFYNEALINISDNDILNIIDFYDKINI